ncbi:PilZ domain-containing protein [Alteraurantiacibacter aquimixticola]|uniref:PilZ domain-containing protein n=1 Tax=Alteraurantiacibacter aquimixticola TaxID=2489173 RepID=A0A4T3EZB8_9SPHN|nr:PilZ domain-containing protein [Alteraurantiacibacter aquimixticola]TIX50099.1 PilZ domain-containing protein [Alteraurantiacibacter aquimixticola]
MGNGAQLSVTDMRRSTRHPVDYPVIAEHRVSGDLKLHICNISAHGFMGDESPAVARGDRLIIRLPVVGRIEAYCIWTTEDRAGFQFERIIRVDDFMSMIRELQPNPALRRRG